MLVSHPLRANTKFELQTTRILEEMQILLLCLVVRQFEVNLVWTSSLQLSWHWFWARAVPGVDSQRFPPDQDLISRMKIGMKPSEAGFRMGDQGINDSWLSSMSSRTSGASTVA